MGSDNDGKGRVTRYLVDLSIWGAICDEGEDKLIHIIYMYTFYLHIQVHNTVCVHMYMQLSTSLNDESNNIIMYV